MPMISRGTWITCISIRSSTAWSAAPRIGDGRALVRGRRAACTTLIGGMARPRIFALVNDVGSGPASDGDFGWAGVGRVGPTYGGVRGQRRGLARKGVGEGKSGSGRVDMGRGRYIQK